MVNYVYSSAVAITIGILLISIFTFKTYNADHKISIGGHKYIKTRDQVISVPQHVLEALLIKYRNRLINKANSDVNINPDLLNEVKESLAKHIQLKYGIKYNLYPIELDKYILNQGMPKTDIYDDELVGGVDLSSTTHSLGIIIWYLEKIILENRNNKQTIEIPLILEKVDEVLAVAQPVSPLSQHIYDSSFNNSVPSVIDIMDDGEQWRLPTKASPKKCSATLRNNLQNYISDSSAQDIENVFSVGDDVNMKAKNMRKASANWQKNNIFRMADVSHTRDDLFVDSHNPQLHQNILYADYDLPLKLMKDDLNNRTYDNQKQTLTDSWDYLER